ncbi:IclR family transcriptional regulator [Pseudomaricurvus alkylphenolicus]|uniref:IclR family transcriptional regulator n=1 Tax=Pseudomaricurvus alkylphenolicus TaxID=1306991 RepID=UPI001F0D93E0|nr:IclR family transcriptional regulator [Pseudomaricurvus alkylphenolicus]
MLKVLDLFGPEAQKLDADFIAQEMDLSRATAYRYVKELCDAGLLWRLDGSYALGPRLIELDCMMRQNDPLILAGHEPMQALSEKTGLAVFISVYYDGRVINTHVEQPTKTINLAFGRGRPLPIFKGAQSKVLVSHQKGRRLKRIFEEHIESDTTYDFSWKDFLQVTKRIRQDGYCQTHDELNLGLTGIAAPINNVANDEVVASLAAAGNTRDFELLRSEVVVELVIEYARLISEKLNP